MIVPMKKATLFCLTSDRESVLEKLRELGFMHFQFEQRGDTQEQSTPDRYWRILKKYLRFWEK